MNGVTLDDWISRFIATVNAPPHPATPVSTLQGLCNELTALVGRPGTDALLARSLYLASQGTPAIAPVTTASPRCEEIGAFLRTAHGPSADDVALPIGGHMLALLAGFIGDQLTRNLLARLAAAGPGDPNESFGR